MVSKGQPTKARLRAAAPDLYVALKECKMALLLYSQLDRNSLKKTSVAIGLAERALQKTK